MLNKKFSDFPPWRLIALVLALQGLTFPQPGQSGAIAPGQYPAVDGGKPAEIRPAEPGGASAGKQGTVNEMREWLNRRNRERKQKGEAIPGRFAGPRLPANQSAERYPGPPGEQDRGKPILHIGQGPDGRIRHRYVIREDGPDQLQVYTGSGYNPLKPETDEEKWARLTPRGRQLWFGGSSLRKPPAVSHPQSGPER